MSGIVSFGNVASPTSTSDPYFSNVSLLIHGDGINNSKVIQDSSPNNFTITRIGNTSISNSQLPFGSISFDGSGDYLTIPYNNAFNWQNSNYTIESWVYASSFSTWSLGASPYYPVMIGSFDPVGTGNTWGFGPISTNKLCFGYYSGVNNVYSWKTVISTASLTTRQWNHIVTCLSSTGVVTLFVNGVLDTQSSIQATLVSPGTSLVIGQLNSRSLSGELREIRITKGIQRYTQTFTLPSTPFPDN